MNLKAFGLCVALLGTPAFAVDATGTVDSQPAQTVDPVAAQQEVMDVRLKLLEALFASTTLTVQQKVRIMYRFEKYIAPRMLLQSGV